MMLTTHSVCIRSICAARFDGACLLSMGMTLAPLIGMPVIRIVQLADGEELVTLEFDQCSGHVIDDPRDELLKCRRAAEASTASAATSPFIPCCGKVALEREHRGPLMVE